MEAGPLEPPSPSAAADSTVVLVPVKRFDAAKERLAGRLSDADRRHLARTMAERVVAAAAPLRVAVVCDDTDVAEWAGDLGARVLWESGAGLDQCVAGAVARLATEGIERAMVAHGDLPLADGLAALTGPAGGVTIVPDRHGDGTNVVMIPTGAGFRFAYGPGSFDRHRDEARRLGLEVTVVRDPLLGLDVDDADDLAAALRADPTLMAVPSGAGHRWDVPVAGS